MRQRLQSTSRYGRRIKKHLSYQSNMRKQLYDKIPSDTLNKLLECFFLEIEDVYDHIFILDLPYITLSIESTNRIKGNINTKHLKLQKNYNYIPFTKLKRCISTRKNLIRNRLYNTPNLI